MGSRAFIYRLLAALTVLSVLFFCTAATATARAEMPVAQASLYGETVIFYDLQEAIDEVSANTNYESQKLTIYYDVDLGSTCLEINSGTITIDLRTRKISGTNPNGVLMINGGNVTIRDSSTSNESTGMLTCDNSFEHTADGVPVQHGTVTVNSGKLTLESGIIENTGNDTTNGNCALYATAPGEISIKGGTIRCNNSNALYVNGLDTVWITTELPEKPVLIEGGNSGLTAVNCRSIEIHSGTIKCTNASGTAINVENSNIKIFGGIVASNGGTAVYAGNNVKLDIGTSNINTPPLIKDSNVGISASSSANVTIGKCDIKDCTYGVKAEGGANVTINNDFSLSEVVTGIECRTGAEVTITGGSINADVTAIDADSCKLNISGGKFISAAKDSDLPVVNISGNCEVNISGGEFVDNGSEEDVFPIEVLRVNGTAEVHITGGTFISRSIDISFRNTSSAELTLGLPEGSTVGARFPGGIKVYDRPLQDLLASDAGYWATQNGTQQKVKIRNEDNTILDKGDIHIGPACTHPNATYEAQADGSHKIECPDCSFNGVVEKCSGGTATCIAQASCDKCKQPYGAFGEHTYSELIPAQGEVHSLEELKGAVAAHYRCTVCNAYFTEEKKATTLEELTADAPVHRYDEPYNTDPVMHAFCCVCGARTMEGPHEYNNIEDLECNICKYVRVVYIVTFDANGGSGTMEPQAFTGGVPQMINANMFTRPGYVFAGWNTEADGSGDFINNSDVVEVNSTVTLYAQWNTAPYIPPYVPPVESSKAEITAQPMDAFIVDGQRAEFSVNATGDGLGYQWYIDRNDGRGWVAIDGAESAVYVTAVADTDCDGYRYYCRIVDRYGNTVSTDVAILHVSDIPVIPETGDPATPLLWLALSLLGITGMALVAQTRKLV